MKTLNKESLIINISTRVIIKNKGLQNLKNYLDDLKNKNALVLVDSFFKTNKIKLNYIKNSLFFLRKKKYIFNNYFEPNFNNLKYFKNKIINDKFDFIIAIGGGSTMDLAKGLSVVLQFKGRPELLQGMNKFEFNPLPVVCIPSIFGSGAEITPSAVFINEKNKIKGGINSSKVSPKIAILDSYLAESNNYKQHATCAFDALVHSIESYVSILSNDFTKNMALAGIENIFAGLSKLKKNNISSFENLAFGSLYSVISLMHSEQSIAGASSYPMAVYYNKNHAVCGANYLISSINLINSKKRNLWRGMTAHLYKKKLINEDSVKSLTHKLEYFKFKYDIEKIKFSEKEITFLVKKIKEMKMLDYTPVKFNSKDIKKFLA